MANEPDYYQLLGVEPTADQATIDAAYQGRSLRFRLGQLRDRAQAMTGPTQEEIERAHAVLSDPASRASYDATYFPGKATRTRRRRPLWIWAVAAFWIVAIAAVCVIGARSRLADDGGAIGRVVATTAVSPPVVAAASPASTDTPPTATQAPAPSATVQPTAPPATATATVPPPATAPPGPPSQIFRPTETPEPSAVAVTTAIPPTGTAVPAPTPIPPAPTAVPVPPTEPPPPPPTEPPPPPEPTPTPVFPATDRIGTTVPVNLRNGPGTNFATLGALPPGTLLAATGETANAGGFLWRRFRLQDGRVGWVRDVDVLPAR